MPTITENLRYPIGKYESQPYSEELKQVWINDIRFLPQTIENAISNLDESQLLTQYREDGWTLKQVVHHVADSHINAYCRFKLGLTEDNPVIRTYEEKLWAELPDTHACPVNISTTLLFALHARWTALLTNMNQDDFLRTVYHPEHKKNLTLWHLTGMYAWHGKHHVAHIDGLRDRNGWR
ncbi:MAG TPA: putative metal-dependent hydrolase [Flavitalea sp.]|nr:putative metal-dependent hydrolase [Flavitalea sp.]